MRIPGPMIMVCHTLRPRVPTASPLAVECIEMVEYASDVARDAFEDGGRL